jgi:uncharacterized membrane protein YkgB
MGANQRLTLSLLLLRIGVFTVMFIWTLDKFIRPDHAAAVYQKFYFLGGLGPLAFYIIGAIELLILIGFLFGFKKRWTYGAVLLFHAVSTFSSYQQYLSPFEGTNLLFFAAWPMLAACFSLYILRDQDTKWVI